MDFPLDFLESQLKKRLSYRYKWGRKQSDVWDRFTSFIYETPVWEEFIVKLKSAIITLDADKGELFDYAGNRWFNFWSAMAVETIFAEIEGVNPAKNSRDTEKDFFIDGIPFDHKTSVFPKHLGTNITSAKANKADLITWFYENQSVEKRLHFKNRLFIVVFDQNGEHWKLKAEVSLLKKEIHRYLATYQKEQLITSIFAEDSQALSDIIWVTR